MSLSTFDAYQFAGRAHQQHPVHAEFDGHGFQSTGIAFEDYARMQTQQHALAPSRQQAAPLWALNDTQLRQVVLRAIEARAYQSTRALDWEKTGTDAERLARAQRHIAKYKRPQLETILDKLCKQFMEAKREGDAALLKHYSQKIEEVDTTLCMVNNPAKYYVGCAYHYWRAGLDSVATGFALGLKPPHVRQLVWRMTYFAGQLGFSNEKKSRSWERKRSCRRSAGKPVTQETSHLIPVEKRLPLVIKLHKQGKTRGEIRRALGWRGDDGYGMVKRLQIQARLR